MHQRPARKIQQRLRAGLALGPGQALEAVLVDRQVHVLREIGLEFGRRHRHAVQEQHQIDHVVVAGAALAHYAQAVGGVACLQLGVHAQRGLELRHAQRRLQAQHVEAVAQHLQRAAFVQRLAQPVQQHGRCRRAVVLGQRFPGLRLGGLHPGQHVGGEQGAGGLVAPGVAVMARRGVQPAVGAQVFADVGLELDFVVQCQVVLPFALRQNFKA